MENFTNWCIIVLLIIAILYALILNFRLLSFNKGRNEIQKTVQSFNQVVQNAETTLSQLQKRTQNITEQLKEEINKASQLRDDLVLILDKSTHFQTPIATQEKEPVSEKTQKTVGFSKASTVQPINLYQSDAEKELYMALQKLKEES